MRAASLRKGLLGLTLVLAPLAAEAAKKSSSTVTGVVNLNRATPEQLKMLPGVKDKAAAAIVAHREKHPFTRIEELIHVEGFTQKHFDRIKSHLSVSGETTLKVHKAPDHKGRSAKKPRIH